MDGFTRVVEGWGTARAEATKAAFYEFLNHCRITSKESSEAIVLGHHLYDSQIRVIDAVFAGLAIGKHDFKVLKSRQLGISTIVRALMLFWAGIFEVKGALVFHTREALDDARLELLDMLANMDPKYRFPRKQAANATSITLANKSRVGMLAAGVKETKGANALGAGRGLSLVHRSELCSYGNAAGLESMRHSLARVNPNRLFIDESTARGANLWKDIWDEALLDDDCVCVFVGWWSHPDQRAARGSATFEKYSKFPLTDDEKRKIKAVKDLYDYEITLEQLVWIRKEMDVDAAEDESDRKDFSGDPLRIQEQPWVADDAFQMTGAVFFDPAKLTDQMNKWVSKKYQEYTFAAGFDFVDFQCFPAPNRRSVHLKVWEEPVEDSTYIIAADPAYGINEHNDRSAVQVLRAYSDGLDQVAEYAWPLIDAQQLAWVIAALEAWYSGERSEVFRIIELNGPGEATWRELRSLKQKIQYSYFGTQLADRGLQNVQRNVKNYLFARSDGMAPGQSFMWKTSMQLKIAIMERLRDFTNTGVLRLRSMETLEEMRVITREGDSIGADGSHHDDRVLSLAMACRQWDDSVRARLMRSKRTREAEASKRRMSLVDAVKTYNEAQFSRFLAGRSVQRQAEVRAAQIAAWRRR